MPTAAAARRPARDRGGDTGSLSPLTGWTERRGAAPAPTRRLGVLGPGFSALIFNGWASASGQTSRARRRLLPASACQEHYTAALSANDEPVRSLLALLHRLAPTIGLAVITLSSSSPLPRDPHSVGVAAANRRQFQRRAPGFSPGWPMAAGRRRADGEQLPSRPSAGSSAQALKGRFARRRRVPRTASKLAATRSRSRLETTWSTCPRSFAAAGPRTALQRHALGHHCSAYTCNALLASARTWPTATAAAGAISPRPRGSTRRSRIAPRARRT